VWSVSGIAERQLLPGLPGAADGAPLTFAGLWDEWKDVDTGEPLKSCAIIVTAANEFARQVHDRMPVIVDTAQFEPWLSGAEGTDVLKPAPDGLLQMWPVSRRVNSSRAPGDDPTLIDRVTA